MTKLEEQKQTAMFNKGKRMQVNITVLNMLKTNLTAEKPIPQATIAEMCGCSIGKVNSIKKKLDKNDKLSSNELHEQKRGRKANPFSKINEQAYNMLDDAISNYLPRDFKIEETSWTGKAIKIFLSKECNIDVTLKYVYRFMKKMNFTSKFASRENPKKDEEYVEYFKMVIFAEICLIALLAGKKIYFLDQCHVQKGNHVKGFAKKGEKAHASHSTELLHSSYSFMTIIGLDGS